jgi:hypothetical protein
MAQPTDFKIDEEVLVIQKNDTATRGIVVGIGRTKVKIHKKRNGKYITKRYDKSRYKVFKVKPENLKKVPIEQLEYERDQKIMELFGGTKI